ncbi:hypothetical protein QUB68_03145 [Microcoleus sp. A006_D1]|uniref:hypothetical protein n=1 Tax=Microcoleus sp. A006_D1 TaxID=3055267 RepID=UPI002FD3E9A6
MTLINRVLAFNIVWVGAMAQKYLMKISEARSLLGIFTGIFVKQALSILISYKQLSVNKHRVLCDRHETADDGLARDRSINQLAVSRLQSGAN